MGPCRRTPEAGGGTPLGGSKTQASLSVVVAVECESIAETKRAVVVVGDWLASRKVRVLLSEHTHVARCV